MTTKVFYDGDCPFCTNYVGLLRLREAAGPVALVNLRDDVEARGRFVAEGLDPDQGMIVENAGRRFHGADAVHALSLMSTRNGTLNALMALVFHNRFLVMLLYPLMRAGRNLTLFALGRPAMRAQDPAEGALFSIFARFFGLLAVLHVLVYFFRFAPLDFKPTAPFLMFLGFALIFNPASRRIFAVLVLVFAIDGWLQAPIYSNHTILKNFVVVTFLLAGLWHWLRGSSFDRFFSDIRPVAQMLLLIMYTFGIFHKINSDFLNPATSCAVALWREMPPPLVWIDNSAMHYLAIYGTFAVEGVLMLMLIVPRWRHWGICGGIGFHSLLALSGYAMYPAFSTLALLLHTLFISPSAGLRVTQSVAWQRFETNLRSVGGFVVLVLAFTMIAYFALLREYGSVALIWMSLIIWPCTIIALKGGALKDEDQGRYFWSPMVALNAVTLLFFLNAAAPYLGLKTAQSMNMFANLRLEGGVSNHLVFRNPPGPFQYLEDVVVVVEATGSPMLEAFATRENSGLVYYHFLSLLSASGPGTQVAYLRGGEQHFVSDADVLLSRDGGMLHPEWMRKYFHFRPVDLTLPLPCD